MSLDQAVSSTVRRPMLVQVTLALLKAALAVALSTANLTDKPPARPVR